METSIATIEKTELAEIMSGDVFKTIIASVFDAEKSTEKRICLVFEVNNFRLELTYNGHSDISIEEVCFFDGDEYVSYELTNEQMEELTTIAENYYEEYMDEVADAKEYQRDVYAYHGMSRSDFY